MKKLITAIALLAIALVCGAWSFGNVRIGQFRKALPYSGVAYTTNTWATNQTLGTLDHGHTGRIGVHIVPRENLYVTDLGRWKVAGNSQTHEVSIVDIATTNVLAKGSVDLSSGEVGFVYFTLTNECILYAGREYAIWSYETSGGDYWYDNSTVLETTTAAYASNATYSLAGAYDPYSYVGALNNSYGPVNFKYANVPIAPWKNPSLVLFAEAQSISGAAGTLVSVLPDQSANGYSLSQETSGAKPILTNDATLNGKKYMLFDGARSLTNLAAQRSQPYTLYALAKYTGTGNETIYGGQSSWLWCNGINGLYMYAGDSYYSVSSDNNQWLLYEATFNDSSSILMVNGTNINTIGTSAGNGVLDQVSLGATFGGGNPWTGKLAAFSIYGNLSDDSRAAIRNYYRTNYNLW